MGRHTFSDEDLEQIKDHGLTVDAVQKHLELFNMPSHYLKLIRPCVPGDGIKVIDQEEIAILTKTYELEALKGRSLKFVPASGAASRMFKSILGYLNHGRDIIREPIARESGLGKIEEQEILTFMNGIKKFAFFEGLESVMSKKGFSIERLIEKGQFTDIVRFLLTEKGLGYAYLPKGLLKFHDYLDGSRTAFEEHLVEAASYVIDQNRQCFLYFTVSPEHMEEFRNLLKRVRPVYEKKYEVEFNVTFSVQKKYTDTLAVDLQNKPFQKKDGRLLFRPGGHGALIENLNDLKGDIVFVKNIDNVAPDRLKSATFRWKKVLGGYLIAVQKQIFRFMEKLASGAESRPFLRQVEKFVKDELCFPLCGSISGASTEAKRAALLEVLDRPIRVCGMVKNEGEPGGGPFWVEEETGESSLQIVEKAQIDPESGEQQAILGSSTHFNPVDLVCGVRDWQGRPFQLRRFIDSKAVLISQKSEDGKDLKALEHPGLWNGAMARWITLFVEVPSITFNPVKSVSDLLRKEHQPSQFRADGPYHA